MVRVVRFRSGPRSISSAPCPSHSMVQLSFSLGEGDLELKPEVQGKTELWNVLREAKLGGSILVEDECWKFASTMYNVPTVWITSFDSLEQILDSSSTRPIQKLLSLSQEALNGYIITALDRNRCLAPMMWQTLLCTCFTSQLQYRFKYFLLLHGATAALRVRLP